MQWPVPLCLIVVCFCFVSETEQRQRNVGPEKWISKVITRKKEARLACEVDRQILWGLCFPPLGTELLLSAWELSGWSFEKVPTGSSWKGRAHILPNQSCVCLVSCNSGWPSPSQGLSLISYIIFYRKSSAAWKPGAQWLYMLSAQQDHQLLEDKAKSHVNCAFFVVLARRTANSEDVGVIWEDSALPFVLQIDLDEFSVLSSQPFPWCVEILKVSLLVVPVVVSS